MKRKNKRKNRKKRKERKRGKKENKKRNNNRSSSCRPQQKSNHRLYQVADYQPGDCLKEGTQIFILLLVQPIQKKVNHGIVFPPSGSNNTQQLVTVIFMQD